MTTYTLIRKENLNIHPRGNDPEGDGAEGRFGNLWADLESCACLWKNLHDHKNRQKIKNKVMELLKRGKWKREQILLAKPHHLIGEQSLCTGSYLYMVPNSSNFSLSFRALSLTPRRDQGHFNKKLQLFHFIKVMQIVSCERTAQEVFIWMTTPQASFRP